MLLFDTEIIYFRSINFESNFLKSTFLSTIKKKIIENNAWKVNKINFFKY